MPGRDKGVDHSEIKTSQGSGAVNNNRLFFFSVLRERMRQLSVPAQRKNVGLLCRNINCKHPPGVLSGIVEPLKIFV